MVGSLPRQQPLVIRPRQALHGRLRSPVVGVRVQLDAPQSTWPTHPRTNATGTPRKQRVADERVPERVRFPRQPQPLEHPLQHSQEAALGSLPPRLRVPRRRRQPRQHLEGLRAQRHRPLVPRLGAPAFLGPHVQHVGRQVDVDPRPPHQLAESRARLGQQRQRRPDVCGAGAQDFPLPCVSPGRLWRRLGLLQPQALEAGRPPAGRGTGRS